MVKARMTFRERVLLGIIGSCLTLAMFAPSCDPKPKPVTRHDGIVLDNERKDR